MTVHSSRRYAWFWAALGLCGSAHADDSIADPGCAQDEVLAHVRAQFRLYGPLSRNREYFGFIYRSGGFIESSVIRGNVCARDSCVLNTAPAAEGIPAGAKVLGEWHTHPQVNGSRNLSAQDVRGAWRNRHIHCYTAFYSQPDGDIHQWDITAESVVVATSSRVALGNYWSDAESESRSSIIAAHQDPGSKCLSTNTNVQTADTATRSCRKSATSH